MQRLLLNVDKPARYTGGELNMIRKDSQGKLRFALCFPDVYEVGMSHLGSRILYEALNREEFAYCERAFSPWTDMEQQMRENSLPLCALESGDPLACFDILGFSLQYEMSYTNVLNMLDLSGIPLYAKDRDDTHPLIVVGGPCAYHAEPLAPFVDLMLLGDGEQTIVDLSQAVFDAKSNGTQKAKLLQSLCKKDGFYVPSLYELCYDEQGLIREIKAKDGAPQRVKKAVVTDLEHAVYPLCPILPSTAIIHDRAVLELFRGCTRGCRFCQAGYVYRPVRNRTKQLLAEQARELILNTGYEEISLTSLSSGDYPDLVPLMEDLRELREKRVSLSLPSLRIDSFLRDYAEGTAGVRKSGLTFAPEAGTQRLRDIINKGVTEEDLLRSVGEAFQAGYSNVKLYFMLGLPKETDEDLLGIVDLAKKVVDLYYSMPKEKRAQPPQVSISVSPFIPKPFTPFQWEPQATPEELRRKQQLLRDALKHHKRIKLSSHDARLCTIEAVLARGDRNLSDVLYKVWQKGAHMEGWAEHFRYDLWIQALSECNRSVAFYASRQRSEEEILPWDHIDVGVGKRYLIQERDRAFEGLTTPDCRQGCTGCGLMDVCGGIS